MKKRNKPLKRLEQVMEQIVAEKKLSASLCDHSLKGDWVYHRECYLEPDWLLIYKLLPQEKVVIFVRTGTHSDLF